MKPPYQDSKKIHLVHMPPWAIAPYCRIHPLNRPIHARPYFSPLIVIRPCRFSQHGSSALSLAVEFFNKWLGIKLHTVLPAVNRRTPLLKPGNAYYTRFTV
jgi:hypothetical protein